MPFFTLHRNFVLRTTKGHAIGFVKGQKTWVPPICVPDVVAIGAVADESVDVLEPEEQQAIPLTPQQRKDKIVAAFEKLLARNERGDFSASGLPNARKLEELCGFEVPNRERDAEWLEFTSKQAEEQ